MKEILQKRGFDKLLSLDGVKKFFLTKIKKKREKEKINDE